MLTDFALHGSHANPVSTKPSHSNRTPPPPPPKHTLSHCRSLTSTHHTKKETTATGGDLTPSDCQLLLLLQRCSAAASKHAAQALWAEEFLEGCEWVVGDLCLWWDDGQALSLGKVTGAALVLVIVLGTAVQQQQPWWSEVRGCKLQAAPPPQGCDHSHGCVCRVRGGVVLQGTRAAAVLAACCLLLAGCWLSRQICLSCVISPVS